MIHRLVGEVRRRRDAVQNMFGTYRGKYVALSARRIEKFGLIDDWMEANESIFIHVPKVAGRSIFAALGAPIHEVSHVPAEAYRIAAPQVYDRYYTFGFTRNPWDRLVSAFTFMRTKDSAYNLALRASELRNVEDFETFLQKLKSPFFRNRILTRMHFMPQTHYLCDAHLNVIVDAVGRFEDLPNSFQEATAKLANVAHLENRNSSDRQDYRRYYRERWQIELVARMYEADCHVFGYAFDG